MVHSSAPAPHSPTSARWLRLKRCEIGHVTCALLSVCVLQAHSQTPPPPFLSSMDEERGPSAISPEPPDVRDPGPPTPSSEAANGCPQTDPRPGSGKSTRRTRKNSYSPSLPSSLLTPSLFLSYLSGGLRRDRCSAEVLTVQAEVDQAQMMFVCHFLYFSTEDRQICTRLHVFTVFNINTCLE